MATTLATLTDRVEEILADTGNAIWSSDNIEEAIRQALHEYSQVRPQEKETSLTLAADGREVSTGTITDLIDVTEIWINYDSTDPQYPAPIRPFRFWKDIGTIYVMGQYEPQNADVVRVFYTALHTLDDLDSATATTIPDEDDTTLAHGAAGFAAITRSVDLAEMISVDREAVKRMDTWGQQRLSDFRLHLQTIARKRQAPTAHVPTGSLDRYDGDWT